MFKGTYTAIVTPFKSGEVDEPALRNLIRMQIEAGVEGIVPVGTTGESPTLSFEEHTRVIQLAVEYADKKLKVIAGTGANSTSEAVYLTRAAEKAGADASLLVAPYYNKPTQEGLFQHFREIARSTKLPIILYNIPGRCGVEIALDTVKRLAESCANIVGIKEAGGNSDRVSQMALGLGGKFCILSGDDSLTLPFMAAGACGVISVASNVIPRQLAQMVRDFAAGQLAAAQKTHFQYFPLMRDLFIETNPGPVKAALAMLGHIQEEYRLPIVPMAAKNRDALKATLQNYGLLK
jgi:4-hydroxy-tetrahydrodipicolinate synthase